MTKDKIIVGSAVTVLKMIIRSMMEHCFLLAHENELSDLKGIIPAENIGEYDEDGMVDWSADMQLLGLVTDPVVYCLMNMIRKLERHIAIYSKANDLEWVELASDQEIMYQTGLTWLYVMDRMKYQNYEEILDTLSWLIECYGMVIWNLAYQQIHDLEDVFLQTEIAYYEWDGNVKLLGITNENAVYLLNIYTDIQLDAAELEQFRKLYYGEV